MEMIIGLIGLIIALVVLAALCAGVFFLFKKMTGFEGSKTMSGVGLGRLNDSLAIRIIFACLLILVSFIPLSFVQDLIHERSRLYNQVSERMTQEWSGAQTLAGPVLSIPYTYLAEVTDKVENIKTGEIRHVKKQVTRNGYLHILPEKLNITSELQTDELKRGIYKVPIYDSTHHLSGYFEWPDLSVLDHTPETIIWERALLTFMITSPKGITGDTQLTWNELPVHLSAGSGLPQVQQNSVHARLKLTPAFQQTPASFDFTLLLRGSKSVHYAPTGRQSEITLKADWPHPSFGGQILPLSRTIESDRFHADWNVAHLSRSYPQFTALSQNRQQKFFQTIQGFAFGVDLFQTIDLYTVLQRTAKYGILFITLTFFTVFIVEFSSGVRLHWVQHLVIGGALSLFYLCVLAMSEHLPFSYAYMTGAGIIALMVALYAKAVIGSWSYGLSIGGVMIALYTILYSILQMEDYALLIGTLLLLAFLAIGMYMTRRLHTANTGPDPLKKETL